MNFGIRREEAIYLRDLILVDRANYPDEIIARDMNYHEARELEHTLIYLDKDKCYNIKG